MSNDAIRLMQSLERTRASPLRKVAGMIPAINDLPWPPERTRATARVSTPLLTAPALTMTTQQLDQLFRYYGKGDGSNGRQNWRVFYEEIIASEVITIGQRIMRFRMGGEGGSRTHGRVAPSSV